MRTLLILSFITYEITWANLQNKWIEMSRNLRTPANSWWLDNKWHTVQIFASVALFNPFHSVSQHFERLRMMTQNLLYARVTKRNIFGTGDCSELWILQNLTHHQSFNLRSSTNFPFVNTKLRGTWIGNQQTSKDHQFGKWCSFEVLFVEVHVGKGPVSIK